MGQVLTDDKLTVDNKYQWLTQKLGFKSSGRPLKDLIGGRFTSGIKVNWELMQLRLRRQRQSQKTISFMSKINSYARPSSFFFSLGLSN